MRDSRKIRYSNKSFEDTLSELRLFEQMEYCKNYIYKRFDKLSEGEVVSKAKISSACFRQAFQFYKAAKASLMSTSPLLYSYCANNLVRGFINLYSIDSSEIDNLERHGFQIKKADLKDNLMDSIIRTKEHGTVNALQLVLRGHVIKSQEVSFKSLLSHIPEISNIFRITSKEPSNTAQRFDNSENNYEIQLVDFEDDMKK
jgi:hypothetical protein